MVEGCGGVCGGWYVCMYIVYQEVEGVEKAREVYVEGEGI